VHSLLRVRSLLGGALDSALAVKGTLAARGCTRCFGALAARGCTRC